MRRRDVVVLKGMRSVELGRMNVERLEESFDVLEVKGSKSRADQHLPSNVRCDA